MSLASAHYSGRKEVGEDGANGAQVVQRSFGTQGRCYCRGPPGDEAIDEGRPRQCVALVLATAQRNTRPVLPSKFRSSPAPVHPITRQLGDLARQNLKAQSQQPQTGRGGGAMLRFFVAQRQ